MSLKHPKIALTCLALAVAGAGTAVAVGAAVQSDPAPPEVHAVRGAQPDTAVIVALGAFRAPLATVSDGSSQGKLERLLSSAANDGLAVGDADFDLARAVPVAGWSAEAWIAPAGDGACIYLPDPVDGYGSGCSTLEQIDAGKAYSVLFGGGLPQGKVMIAFLVPDGGEAPRVVHSDGSVTSLAVRSNLAAGLLSSTDKVETDGAGLDLSVFKDPTKVRGVSG
jgi:hypothetical protein